MLRVLNSRICTRFFGQDKCEIRYYKKFSENLRNFNQSNYVQCLKCKTHIGISRNVHNSSLFTPNNDISSVDAKEIPEQLFNVVCEETLESLTEFFEDLLDTNCNLKSADVSYNVSHTDLELGLLLTANLKFILEWCINY